MSRTRTASIEPARASRGKESWLHVLAVRLGVLPRDCGGCVVVVPINETPVTGVPVLFVVAGVVVVVPVALVPT